MSGFPTNRPRRLRASAALREMLATVRLDRRQLVSPLFVRDGQGLEQEISSMPGQFQLSVDRAMETVRRWSDLGLGAVLLFGIPDRKDASGSGAWDDAGAVQELTRQIKRALPSMLVITDVCLCEYTDHGHCGLLGPGGRSARFSGFGPASTQDPEAAGNDKPMDVDNDATLELLARTAVSHARAGADIVAPSAMMDGQVGAIRQGLDAAGLTNTALMAYAVKFASCMYGPFRDAAESAPAFGDRRTYQMDPLAPRQAIEEARQDIEQGADILMVKPAATYLDIIAQVRARFDAPLAAYHVSGEYSMIKAAARLGWLDEKRAAMEVTAAIHRAGADVISTYFAPQLAAWLKE